VMRCKDLFRKFDIRSVKHIRLGYGRERLLREIER
jgi:hypothetical protein